MIRGGGMRGRRGGSSWRGTGDEGGREGGREEGGLGGWGFGDGDGDGDGKGGLFLEIYE